MQSSVGIRERIDHVYPSLRPAERAVAKYIRNHIEGGRPDRRSDGRHRPRQPADGDSVRPQARLRRLP